MIFFMGYSASRTQRQMTSRRRIPIPKNRAAEVLFQADHTCCKCGLSGKTLQIHHIDENPKNNDAENLAVLCLECHEETQIRGGFGRHLSAEGAVQYRDDWNTRVQKRREEADALAAAAMARVLVQLPTDLRYRDVSAAWTPPAGAETLPPRDDLIEYIARLPELRRQIYMLVHARRPNTTLDTVETYGLLIDVLKATLVKLLSYYPEGHFAEAGPASYVSTVVAEHTHWHYLRTSHNGVGNSGTLVQVHTVLGVVRDLERLIEETVSALTGTEVREPDELEKSWLEAWRKALPWDIEGA